MTTKVNFRTLTIENAVKNNGRNTKTIAFLSGRTLPKLRMSNYTIDLFSLRTRLEQMAEGSILVFGRATEHCDIVLSHTDRTVSRIHCYVKKNTASEYEIVDCSLNGTQVIL